MLYQIYSLLIPSITRTAFMYIGMFSVKYDLSTMELYTDFSCCHRDNFIACLAFTLL